MFYSRQRAPDDRQLIIYSVVLVFTRGRDLSGSGYGPDIPRSKRTTLQLTAFASAF